MGYVARDIALGANVRVRRFAQTFVDMFSHANFDTALAFYFADGGKTGRAGPPFLQIKRGPTELRFR
jgi:hypothetical protein